MNYSTLKKTVVLSFVSLMAVGMASAQTATDTTKMAGKGTAKVFGGASQYSTWSLGVNVGVTSGEIAFMQNTTSDFKANLGYGLDLRDQLTHSLSIQLEYYGGKVEGNDSNNPGGTKLGTDLKPYAGTAFSTKFNSVSLGGTLNIGSISFLHRQNGLLLYVNAGVGLDFYTPTVTTYPSGAVVTYASAVKELAAPVGSGLKFKLSDALALNLGYTMTFVDGTNFSGFHTYPTLNHYAYTYAGLEYTFGTKSKSNIEWVNPVAMMYDELYDAALRQEVEALKGRVANVETAVNDLKKDSDGDGVADQFDKCPNTPAGTVVDGSGCPIVFPKPDTVKINGPAVLPAATAYSNIQFEFDSSVLKTSSYPVLDATSADLRSSGAAAELDGFASSEGTAAHNMRLSKDRANSVKTYLVNSGVPAKKLKIKGFGETHPIADNSTEDGRILNRRVEFKKK
jgi:OmpA-OmpF porin, OOP family